MYTLNNIFAHFKELSDPLLEIRDWYTTIFICGRFSIEPSLSLERTCWWIPRGMPYTVSNQWNFLCFFQPCLNGSSKSKALWHLQWGPESWFLHPEAETFYQWTPCLRVLQKVFGKETGAMVHWVKLSFAVPPCHMGASSRPGSSTPSLPPYLLTCLEKQWKMAQVWVPAPVWETGKKLLSPGLGSSQLGPSWPFQEWISIWKISLFFFCTKINFQSCFLWTFWSNLVYLAC